MSHCYKIGFPPKSCSHLIEIHTNTLPYTMHSWNIYGRWLITHKLALNALECLKMLCFTTMSHCYIFSFRAHVFQIYSQNPFYIPQWLWWWCAKVFRWYCDMMYSDVFSHQNQQCHQTRILSAAPVASILASDMLSQKFTKNWQYTPQNWIMATISGPKRNNLNNQIFQQL